MIRSRLYPLPHAFYWLCGGAMLLLFALFLFTMASTVSFEDSGLFGMVCYNWGVAHPPMYPFYTLLCPIFAHLPFVSPIHGVAIFSALNAVIACLFIAIIVVRLSGMVIPAIVAALIYGVSDSFWAQAIIQEVYTLNSALFFVALWRVIEFSHRPHGRNFHLMVFFSVLGLSNHWPLMMLSAIGFPIIILPVWRDFFRLWWSKHGVLSVLLIAVALSPYMIMWLRSLADPVISFYGPIDNWDLFWFVITRQGYSGVDNAGGNWLDKQEYLCWLFASMTTEQTTWLGVFCALLGIVFLWRRGNILLSLGCLFAILGGSVLLVVLLDFKFNDFSRSIFRVYPLVSWGMIALLAGLGMSMVAHDYRRWRKNKSWDKYIRFSAVIFLLIPMMLLAQNFHKNNRPSITWAHKWAMIILQSLDKNALLFTHDDTHLPLMYLHNVEGVREDVHIYNTQSLIFNNRLTKARVSSKQKAKKYHALASTSSRPFYTFYESENPYGAYWNGVFYQSDKTLKKGEIIKRLNLPFFTQLIDGMDAFKDQDGWSRNQKFKYANKLSTLLLELPTNTTHYSSAREKILSVPFGQFAYASAWFEHRLPVSEEQLAFDLIEKVEPLVKFLPPYQQARHYDTYARVHSVRANRIDYQEIESILLKGVEAYDWNDNLSLYTLLELYAQIDDKEKFDQYINRYPNGARGSKIVGSYQQGEVYHPDPIISPEKANKMLEQAFAFLRNEPKNPDEALRLSIDLVKYYPNEANIHFVIGGSRMLRQEYDLAEKFFLRTIQLDAKHIAAKYNLLIVYLRVKKYKLLENLLTQSLQEHPKEPLLLKIQQQWKKIQSSQ